MAEKAEFMEAKLPAGEVLSMEPQDYDAMERDFREARNLGRETSPLEQHTRRLCMVRLTNFSRHSSAAVYCFAEAERSRSKKQVVVCATGQSSVHTVRRAQEARIALAGPHAAGDGRVRAGAGLRALRCCARSRTTAAWSASGRSTPSCSKRCAARTVRARLVPSLTRLPAARRAACWSARCSCATARPSRWKPHNAARHTCLRRYAAVYQMYVAAVTWLTLHIDACLPVFSPGPPAVERGTHSSSSTTATGRVWRYIQCRCAADTERRLTKRCRELGAELVGSAAKVAAALRLGEDDAAAIAALKAEIEKAWRLVDASADKALPFRH